MRKDLNGFISLLGSILEEAALEEVRAEHGDSPWEEKILKDIVIPEMNELRAHADRGEVYFKYGKKQRMLESTYFMTDSLKALERTSLGQKILLLQDMLNAFL